MSEENKEIIVDQDICQCSERGHCPRFKRRMSKRMYDICQGTSLTPEKCADYRRLWDQMASNPVEENIVYTRRKEKREWSNNSVPSGPGTELKKLLSIIGIYATPNCKCNTRAKKMDDEGPEWCEDNIEVIADWMHEETKRRNLPFIRSVVIRIIRYAIKRSLKKKLRMMS